MVDLYTFFSNYKNINSLIKGTKKFKYRVYPKFLFEKQPPIIRSKINSLWLDYINKAFTMKEFTLGYSVLNLTKNCNVTKLAIKDIKKSIENFTESNINKSKILLDRYLENTKFDINDLTKLQENGENILFNLINQDIFPPNVLLFCELGYETKDKKLNKFKAVAKLIKKLTKGVNNNA
jgi:hypothetical protein